MTRRPKLVDPISCGDHLVSTVATRSCPFCGQHSQNFFFFLSAQRVVARAWQSQEAGHVERHELWADWAGIHKKRIRNLCQAVAPGELRSPSNECVKGLSWRRSHDHDHGNNIDGSCGATDDAHADSAAKPNDALCSYGFDSEVMPAWHAEAETLAQKEVSLPLAIPQSAADSDEVQAEWADGHRKANPELHVGRTRHSRPRRGPHMDQSGNARW